MLRSLSLSALVILAACHATAPVADDPWQPVRFLAGCWRSVSDGNTTEEVWTPPYDGTMYGQNRTLRGQKMVFFELLLIERRGADLVYVARPGGRTGTDFKLTAADTNSVTFANPAHDFPKRIRYWLGEDGALLAAVDDGTDAGKRLDFSWRPVR